MNSNELEQLSKFHDRDLDEGFNKKRLLSAVGRSLLGFNRRWLL
jgi:hypothetical protein